MLLRRVIEHVKTQNWTAVRIDFVIVVVGVFIGIQVSNWNAARLDAAREVEYLQALGRDVRESIGFANEITTSLGEVRAAQAALADHIQAIHPLSPDELERALHQGLYPLATLEVSLATWEELKTAGATPLLRDRDLRFALQELDSRLAQVRQSEADKSEIFYRFSDPYLIENFNLNKQWYAREDPGEERPFVFSRYDPTHDPGEALTTGEFRNILVYRFNADSNQLDAIKHLQEQFVKIDTMVRSRLEALGAARP